MRKVLLINSVIYVPGEGGYKRTLYLFDYLKKLGYTVTLLTSDFNHYSKQKRDISAFRKDYPDYENIEFLSLAPYKRNISIRRYFSELKYKKVVKKWVEENIDKYDVVYVSMPEIPTILGIKDVVNKKRIPMIIDVRDLRPEALRVVLKNELVYRIATYYMKLQANIAYASADELVAVSQEYLDRALSVNRYSKNPKVVYIGSIIEKFDKGVKKYSDYITVGKDEFYLIYAGTIGASYDLETLVLAMEELQKRNQKNIKLRILGQGPNENSLKALCKDRNINNVEFIGFVDYEEMAAYLSKSHVAINALKARGSQSIINKVADYLSAGIPMLSSSIKPEMKKLISINEVGINYEPEDVIGLADAIEYLHDNPDVRKAMGIKARNLALSKFNRETTYYELVKTIEEVEWHIK